MLYIDKAKFIFSQNTFCFLISENGWVELCTIEPFVSTIELHLVTWSAKSNSHKIWRLLRYISLLNKITSLLGSIFVISPLNVSSTDH